MLTKVKNISNAKEKKRLLSNFCSLFILQVFTYILPLLTLPYLVRVLGVETFGLIMFAQAFIVFFNILVDFGFNLSATREIAIYRDDKVKLTEIFSSVMMIKFILIGVSFAIISLVIFSFEKFSLHWEICYLSFCGVIGQAIFPIWYFQGMEEMKYITIVNIISKLFFTIAIFIFVQNEADYILVPLLNGLGFIVGGLISLRVVYKNFNQKFKIQSYATIFLHFKDSLQFFLSRVSVSIYTSSNAFLLGVYTSNTVVGYYSIAEKLYLALQGFYGPITQSLYPYIAKERNIALFKKIFIISLIINTMGIILLYFIGEYIFLLLFSSGLGSEFIEVFHIFLLAALIVVPSILLGYPLLGALGFAKNVNKSVMYGSFIHLSGLLILIITNNLSIYFVASMVFITESFVLLYRIYWVRRENLW